MSLLYQIIENRHSLSFHSPAYPTPIRLPRCIWRGFILTPLSSIHRLLERDDDFAFNLLSILKYAVTLPGPEIPSTPRIRIAAG